METSGIAGTDALPAREVKSVRCPGCGGASVFAPTNVFRPFCSERCKNLDLGAWASESFKLPEQLPDSDPDFEQG